MLREALLQSPRSDFASIDLSLDRHSARVWTEKRRADLWQTVEQWD